MIVNYNKHEGQKLWGWFLLVLGIIFIIAILMYQAGTSWCHCYGSFLTLCGNGGLLAAQIITLLVFILAVYLLTEWHAITRDSLKLATAKNLNHMNQKAVNVINPDPKAVNVVTKKYDYSKKDNGKNIRIVVAKDNDDSSSDNSSTDVDSVDSSVDDEIVRELTAYELSKKFTKDQWRAFNEMMMLRK